MKRIEGVHLIVDGYVQDNRYLNQEPVFKLFDELVDALGMTYLTRPVVALSPVFPERVGTNEDEGGASYWAQITTSHIALHAWPLRNAFMSDIFSCRPFDTDIALRIVKERLNVVEHYFHVLYRTDPKEQH